MFSKFQKDGLVDMQGKQICIRDLVTNRRRRCKVLCSTRGQHMDHAFERLPARGLCVRQAPVPEPTRQSAGRRG